MQNAASSLEFEHYKRVSSALSVADISNRLIHYTSATTLENMLASQELWFGRLTDMNDRAEGNHFLDAVLDQAPRLIIGNDIPGLAALLPMVRDAIRSGTYISSWCEYYELDPDGSLGMWRAYGRGDGVGIVIDSSQFLPSAMTPQKIGFHVMAGKIEYVPPNRAIDHANDYFRRLASVDFLRMSLEDKIVMANMLAIKAPLVKHHGFCEEAEIRFLHMPELMRLMGRSPPSPRIHVKSGREYFAFPLRAYPESGFDFRAGKLLSRVVIGPGGDQNARELRIRRLLAAHGLSHIGVHRSSIPLAA